MLLNEILDVEDEYIDECDLSEDELEEALRRGFAVRKGKRVKIRVKKKRSGKMSSKQRRALKKNRRKAHRSGAKRKRKRSVKIRSRKGIKRIKGGNRSKSRSSNRS